MEFLKVDTQRNYIEAQGTILDISSLVLQTIGAIYDSYHDHGQLTEAEFFKKAIIAAVTSPDSPVFADFGNDGNSVLVDVTELRKALNHEE